MTSHPLGARSGVARLASIAVLVVALLLIGSVATDPAFAPLERLGLVEEEPTVLDPSRSAAPGWGSADDGLERAP